MNSVSGISQSNPYPQNPDFVKTNITKKILDFVYENQDQASNSAKTHKTNEAIKLDRLIKIIKEGFSPYKDSTRNAKWIFHALAAIPKLKQNFFSDIRNKNIFLSFIQDYFMNRNQEQGSSLDSLLLFQLYKSINLNQKDKIDHEIEAFLIACIAMQNDYKKCNGLPPINIIKHLKELCEKFMYADKRLISPEIKNAFNQIFQKADLDLIDSSKKLLADFGNESTSAGIQYVEVPDLPEVFRDLMLNIWDAKFKDNLENFNYLIDINARSFEAHIKTYPLIENSFAEAHKNLELDCKKNLAYNYCSNNVYLKELFEHIKNSLTHLVGDYKQIVFTGLLDEIIRDDFFTSAEFQSTEIEPSEIVSEIKTFLSTEHKLRDFKFFSANKKLLQIDDPDFEAIINFINELKALKDQNKLNYIFDDKKIKQEKTLLINLEIDKIPATNHCTAVTVGFANLKDIEDQEENFQNNLVSDIELVANLTKREINPSSYTSSCISNIGQFANDLKRSKGDLFVSKEINPPKGEADFLEINYIKDDDDDEDYYLPAGSPSSSLLLT